VYTKSIIVSLFFFVFTTVTFAGTWEVSKLRGAAFVFESGQWVRLERGDMISEKGVVQTAKRSRITLRRGKESLEVRSDTRVRINDPHGSRQTVVFQDFGELIVDVEKKNVEHFAIKTPILAAVVKGTKFKVTARGAKAEIEVQRGVVEAQDTKADMKVNVKSRQAVELNKERDPFLTVSGSGNVEPIREISTNRELTPEQVIKKAVKAHANAQVTQSAVKEVVKQQRAEEARNSTSSNSNGQLNATAATQTQSQTQPNSGTNSIVEVTTPVDDGKNSTESVQEFEKTITPSHGDEDDNRDDDDHDDEDQDNDDGDDIETKSSVVNVTSDSNGVTAEVAGVNVSLGLSGGDDDDDDNDDDDDDDDDDD
jgi:hypothetical protein